MRTLARQLWLLSTGVILGIYRRFCQRFCTLILKLQLDSPVFIASYTVALISIWKDLYQLKKCALLTKLKSKRLKASVTLEFWKWRDRNYINETKKWIHLKHFQDGILIQWHKTNLMRFIGTFFLISQLSKRKWNYLSKSGHRLFMNKNNYQYVLSLSTIF